MKLSKYMWEIWQYAAYGEKKTGSGVGVGIDMMHANLRTGKENYPEAGVTLDYNDLGKKWEAMDADEKGHQLSEAVKIKDRGYERLAEAFRENDREKFERVVFEVEAEMEPKEN